MAKRLIEGVFLGPGNLACNAMGVGEENNRDLLRMLINSFVWAAVGAVAVAFIV
jgi:hypothetical protein